MSQASTEANCQLSIAEAAKQACQTVQTQLNMAEEAQVQPILQVWKGMIDTADWKTLLPLCIQKGVKLLLVAIVHRQDKVLIQAAMKRGVEYFYQATGLSYDWVMGFGQDNYSHFGMVYIILPTPQQTPNPSFHLQPFEEVEFFRQHGWIVDQSREPELYRCVIF